MIRRLAMISAVPLAIAGTGVYLSLEKKNKPLFGSERPESGMHVVVLGSGWAAMSFLDSYLKNVPPQEDVRVTVVSRQNYFLFTPLLPSVVTGTLEVDSLCAPVRETNFAAKIDFLEGDAFAINPDEKTLLVRDDIETNVTKLTYDKLVVAVGAKNNTFSTPGVREFAHFLKDAHDGIAIRNRLLQNLEKAALPSTAEAEKRRLLSVVVCGGGPTGVEAAAEIMDFLKDDVPRLFGKKLADMASVTIINSRDHILNGFDAAVSAFAEERFLSEDINMLRQARVSQVQSDSVVYKSKVTDETKAIPSGLTIWCTGIAPRSAVLSLLSKLGPGQTSKRGIVVGPQLNAIGSNSSIYAIGDCATQVQSHALASLEALFEAADLDGDGTVSREELSRFLEKESVATPSLAFFAGRAQQLFDAYDADNNGVLDKQEFSKLLREVDSRVRPFPTTAQAATQMGIHLGRHLAGKMDEPFQYKHRGSFSYVGGEQAVLELELPIIGKQVVKGSAAMLLWRSAYLSSLISTRTRALVLFDWIKVTLFGRSVSSRRD